MPPIDKKIPLNEPGIAGFATESWESAQDPRYGEGVPTTTHKTVTAIAALTLPLYSVVNINEDDEITLATVTAGVSNANAILAMPIAMTLGQEMSVAVYREGHWNMDSLNWHASFNTDKLKQDAFLGSDSPTIFVSKKKFPNNAIDI
jgi:hypothetical protein